jgi:hypothetical protein
VLWCWLAGFGFREVDNNKHQKCSLKLSIGTCELISYEMQRN